MTEKNVSEHRAECTLRADFKRSRYVHGNGITMSHLSLSLSQRGRDWRQVSFRPPRQTKGNASKRQSLFLSLTVSLNTFVSLRREGLKPEPLGHWCHIVFSSLVSFTNWVQTKNELRLFASLCCTFHYFKCDFFIWPGVALSLLANCLTHADQGKTFSQPHPPWRNKRG